MFQDSETDYNWEEKLYSECSVPEEFWEIRSELDRLHVDDDIFDAWLTNKCDDPTADDVHKCQEQYIGKFDSDAAFAQNWYEDCYPELSNSMLYQYIDWDDVYNGEFQHDGFFSDNDYYFDSNR